MRVEKSRRKKNYRSRDSSWLTGCCYVAYNSYDESLFCGETYRGNQYQVFYLQIYFYQNYELIGIYLPNVNVDKYFDIHNHNITIIKDDLSLAGLAQTFKM